MHIWIPETAQEHWAAEKELENLNTIWEPKLRLQWELSTSMWQLNLLSRALAAVLGKRGAAPLY